MKKIIAAAIAVSPLLLATPASADPCPGNADQTCQTVPCGVPDNGQICMIGGGVSRDRPLPKTGASDAALLTLIGMGIIGTGYGLARITK